MFHLFTIIINMYVVRVFFSLNSYDVINASGSMLK